MASIDRARVLFTEIAERHSLTLEWDTSAPVDLAAHLRKQPGLDWSLWLNLQDEEEIGVQGDFFSAEWWWFAGDPVVEAEFIRAVDGLISGEARMVCKFGRHGTHPYVVDIELNTDQGWTAISHYARGIHFGRPAGTMILRNGHEPVLEGRAVEIPLHS